MTADTLTALRNGDYVAALDAARQATERTPTDAVAWHSLGIARLRAGDRDGAREALDRALALRPDRAMFQITRALTGLPVQLLADAASLAPGAPLTQAQVPMAAAELLLLLAQGRNREAESWLARLQAVNPELPTVKLAEGHVLQLRGQAGRALRCFRAAVEGGGGNALANVSLGLACLQHGQFAQAEHAFRAADQIEPGNPGVTRALIEVCRRQGKRQEALVELDKVLSADEDSALRTLRAQLLVATGNAEAGLRDLLHLLDLQPSHDVALPMAVDVLQALGRASEAADRVEHALADNSGDAVWRLRLRLASDDAVYGEVLQRWSQALPESALCLSARARWHERRGELEQARLLAEQALASNPGLATAQLLLLRAEVASDPESALRRIARIRPREDDAAARRSLLAYRGLAADRLGRYADALADWSRMAMVIAASHPLPMPESAQLAPGGKVEGRLLWAPPGVAMEPVLSAVAQVAPERLLAERARAPQRREDGFGVRRFKPTHENAGSGERWQASLRALGHEPAQAIDWLPHFDGYTAAALSGAHTVACLIDPRDALLNWMVFGSTADYVFLPDSKQDADWMAQCLEALADHRDANPLAVTVLNIDTLAEQADSLAAQLQSALALSSAPDPSQLARSPESSPALPMRFPAGHWRHYREVLAEAFARLTPVAQRFGYSAE